ncbi:hypothetical protein Clacol_009935 [Clathrus columnatus]|uniref:Uncharacterized protein n=1 Tax=Clathrus columnatus TaxID=1419009 RepID=A0AAV5APF8_9AGAM|nr:hypothetical protein Clacol_009935 [Clathrus columnatus]
MQAKACAEYFSTIRLATIYSSDLKRAYTTAKAISDAQPEPRCPHVVSEDLREQHFGVAEGEKWIIHSDSGLDVDKKIFPILSGREAKFPDGESLNDLADRATRAVKEFILPWVWDTQKTYGKEEGEIHLAVIIAALVRLDADHYHQDQSFTGLLNTAWSRVTIGIQGERTGAEAPLVDQDVPLIVRVTHKNQHSHLDSLMRQKGGIGSAAYDPDQKDIREYFSGAIRN